MLWDNNKTDMKIFGIKKDREKLKDLAVSKLQSEIMYSIEEWTPLEQTEILNKLILRVAQSKKEELSNQIKKAREIWESVKNLEV